MSDVLEPLDERLAVLLARQGDREALSRLIDAYDKRLLYFIRRILGDSDRSLDVLQSVWLIVHRQLRHLDSVDAFRVWLYRIAHNQAVSEVRKASRGPVFVEQIDAVPEANVADVDESEFENAELVHAALERLSIDHRRVLTLRFLEEMTIEEIAEVISCPAGTVKSRLHYAKDALRREIEEQLHD